jgi:threonine/homoserine/homoserine lactone efflux protein
MLLFLLQGSALGFTAAASPGPLQAFLLDQSVRNGWRRTLPSSLAPLLSDGPILLLVLLILSQTPTWLLNLLRVVGGLFVLYLAWDALSAFRDSDNHMERSTLSPSGSLWKATVTNLLNPNPYIFWSFVAGPILVDGWRQAPRFGLTFMIGFYAVLVLSLAGLIILFAAAGRLDTRLARVLSGLSALALLIFGLYQLWQGLAGALRLLA